MINCVESYSFDDLMLIPKCSDVTSRSQVDLSVNLGKGVKIALPFVPSNMKTITELAMAKLVYEQKGMAIFHRFTEFDSQLAWLEEIKTWGEDAVNFIGFSIGVKEEHYEQVDKLVANGAKIICIDIAHGYSAHCFQMTQHVAQNYPHVLLISGNVADGAGARQLWECGADIVKVGIGAGCFAAGTRILMSNGIYKNIEDVLPGEYVINKNGQPVKVLNAFCTGNKQVAKLRTNTFYEYTYVTPDHQFWVGDLNHYTTDISDLGYAKILDKLDRKPGNPSKYKWKAIGEVQKDLLLMPNKINFRLPETFKIDLYKRSSGNARWKHNDTTQYALDYELRPSYELGYIFGTFLGDGCALATEHNGSHIGNVTWYYGLNEFDVVEKTINCINTVFPKNNVSYNQINNIYNVKFYYKPFADYLYNWGKGKEKNLPSELLIDNKDYLQGLFDGLMDSDGSYCKDGRKAFSNTSIKLVELFNILSFILTGAFPSNTKKLPSVGGLKNCNLENCNTSYTSRINKSNKRLTKNYQIVEKLEYEITNKIVPVYDLEVDCPTHSFIANNTIVHNSICLTRINTGNGVPSMTSLAGCHDMRKYMEVKLGRKLFIMNDGGCKTPGDVAKALCFADLCMVGNLFSATDETPGEIIEIDGVQYKSYVGSSTHRGVHKEGVEGYKKYKGSARKVIQDIAEGLKSCCSYQGVRNLEDLKRDPKFVKISSAGLKESHAHDLDIIVR